MKHHGKPSTLSVGEVVIIASDERNRGKWTLGIVEELFPGRDGIIRAEKVKTANGYLERVVNNLYPLELSCDQSLNQQTLIHSPPFTDRSGMQRLQHVPESRKLQKSNVSNKYSVDID